MLNVILAAVASFLLGGFWFSPAGFGKAWMKEMGLKKSDMKKGTYTPQQSMGICFVLGLVTAFILNQWLTGLDVSMAAQRASIYWAGFMLPILYGQVLWSGKSNRLFMITGSYWLVNVIVMAAILVSF